MEFVWEGVKEAFALLVGGDPDTWFGIWLSLWTSVLAVAIGGVAGAVLGAWVGLHRPFGSAVWVFLFRVGMAVPTVVVGLVLYGLLSRRGPLSGLDLLYTPAAIVVGEVALALPIVASFAHAACARLDPRAVETVRTHGGGRVATLRLALSETRPTLVAAVMAAFGRCVTELGIVTIVGGMIRFETRTLPAQIALETSRGQFGRGVAAGVVLLLLAAGAAEVAHRVSREVRR